MLPEMPGKGHDMMLKDLDDHKQQRTSKGTRRRRGRQEGIWGRRQKELECSRMRNGRGMICYWEDLEVTSQKHIEGKKKGRRRHQGGEEGIWGRQQRERECSR